MFEPLLRTNGRFNAGIQVYKKIKQRFIWRASPPPSQNNRVKDHLRLPPLPSNDEDAKREQKETLMAGTAFVLATAGALLYPPIQLVSIPILLSLTVPALRESYQGLVHERRPNAALVQVAIPVICLLNGYYVAPALNFLLTNFGRRLVRTNALATRHKLEQIFDKLPTSIWIVCDGVDVEIPLAGVKPGDLVVVGAGAIIPVDGDVQQGSALVTQTQLTDTPHATAKAAGDRVLASSLVVIGKLWIRAEKVGNETALAQMTRLLAAAALTPAPCRGKRLANQLALPTLGLSALAGLLLNPVSAIALLNSRLGYDLETLVPAGWLHFLCTSAQAGILVTNGAVLPRLLQVNTLVLQYAASQQPETCAVIRNLREQQIEHVYVVGAPTPFSTRQLTKLGADALFCDTASADQVAWFARLQAAGNTVCYVGDGVVDGALMRQADVGISLRGVADLAENEAEVIFLTADLNRLQQLLQQATTFQAQVENTFQVTAAPGLLNLAGVLLLQSGIFTTIILNNSGFYLGLVQMVRPRFMDEFSKVRHQLTAFVDQRPLTVDQQRAQ